MPLKTDPERARQVGQRIDQAFHSSGILGETSMPEHLLPPGAERGSREQLHFITLTVAIDYMRDADALWAAARATFSDPETRYLYDPKQVVETGIAKLTADMGKHKLAQRTQKDSSIWQTICLTLVQHFQGDMNRLLHQARFNAPRVLTMIRNKRYQFPYLKGDKIGPLWVRMLEESWQRRRFSGMEKLPIAVDVHIAAGTVMTGCVRGPFEGTFKELREAVVQVWFDACQDGEYYPLQFDRPLWHLSRRGCRNTTTFPCTFLQECPVGEFCTATSLDMGYGAAGASEPVRLIEH